ncbi:MULTISPECIES: hypothetical protein [Chelatococcus]|uniref:Uncharacterized protein n=1 Tax=Chelatococcus caeni TaxID=1348468 RepID=A0A840C241_9HYPH|nr:MULTISPECIES: hypothetical protein [Chelatococcus]MBB4017569.1 hypothetical protein [Chelatococcus caeni]
MEKAEKLLETTAAAVGAFEWTDIGAAWGWFGIAVALSLGIIQIGDRILAKFGL